MPSREVQREHRNAASVLAAGLQHQSSLTDKLTQRLQEDGVLAALENGESAPPLPAPPSGDDLVGDAMDPQGPIVSAVTLEGPALEVEPPDQMVDLERMQQFAMWNISFYTNKLLEVDDRLRQEVQQVWVARAARDEATQVAYEQLVAVRQYVAGVLDERAVQSMLDIDGPTPATPFELRDTLRRALRRLQAPETFVPEPRVDGLGPDLERVTNQLQAVFEPLDRAVRKLEREEKGARANTRARAEMRRIHRDALIGWRGMLQNMAIAAGDRELASDFRLPQLPRSTSGGEAEDDPGESPPPAGPFPEEELPQIPPLVRENLGEVLDLADVEDELGELGGEDGDGEEVPS